MYFFSWKDQLLETLAFYRQKRKKWIIELLLSYDNMLTGGLTYKDIYRDKSIGVKLIHLKKCFRLFYIVFYSLCNLIMLWNVQIYFYLGYLSLIPCLSPIILQEGWKEDVLKFDIC